jgi:hypothetical protein
MVRLPQRAYWHTPRTSSHGDVNGVSGDMRGPSALVLFDNRSIEQARPIVERRSDGQTAVVRHFSNRGFRDREFSGDP